jgi:uncharacterized repeat protein (TIGR04138 family)
MQEQKSFYQIIEEICATDGRYKPDAYEFLMQALHFTQSKLKKAGHVTARELLEGIREFVIKQYGPMVKIVLNHWGITKTEDFGNIVFNMVDRKLLSKTDEDSVDDFKDVYDFEAVFGNVLRDSVIKEFNN